MLVDAGRVNRGVVARSFERRDPRGELLEQARALRRIELDPEHVTDSEPTDTARNTSVITSAAAAATTTPIPIVRVAFAEVGLIDVVFFTLPTNRGSRNVMEKCGFVANASDNSAFASVRSPSSSRIMAAW